MNGKLSIIILAVFCTGSAFAADYIDIGPDEILSAKEAKLFFSEDLGKLGLVGIGLTLLNIVAINLYN